MDALVICDRSDELAALIFALRQVGVTCTQASDLETGMRLFADNPGDLMLVALRRPALLSQVRRVRQDSEGPLLVISNTADEDLLCEAYEAGADDVITRPYSLRLVTMRCKALLRRASGTTLRLFPSFSVGPLTLDPSTRMIHVAGQGSRRLTHLEFRLLHTLMLHRGQTVPMETIVERVWGYDGTGDTALVRGLVRRLRGKVEPNPTQPQYIVSIPGVGYRLEVEE